MKNNQYIYEKPIIYIIILILFLGSVILYNASSTLAINRFGDYSFYIDKHLIRISIGIIAFLAIYYLINFSFIKKNALLILILSWICMLTAYYLNKDYTTSRWLIINGKNLFTTSDFAKLALIIFTSKFIEDNKSKINNINVLLYKFIPYFLITILLVFFQPDLSTSFSISLIIVSLLIISGLKLKYLFVPFTITCIGVFVKIYSTAFQRARFENWWYGGNANIQTENSINALGNGGLFGVGFGNSLIKEGFLPEVHTDFILPIIGEEFGFIGILVLFILFLSFYFYGLNICKSAPDIFSSMLSLGIILNILYYFLINASYVVGLFPTTGLPIPFFSYGGSHTLFNMISIGILMNISNYTNIYKYKYINYE